MREIFGMPMSTILIVLVTIFTVSMLSVVLIAWRRPVLFKLGVRNIPRRRAQSTLIVIGLYMTASRADRAMELVVGGLAFFFTSGTPAEFAIVGAPILITCMQHTVTTIDL